VITDFGGESADQNAVVPATARPEPVCECVRTLAEVIESGLSRGRNAKAVWQDLVDDHGFTGAIRA